MIPQGLYKYEYSNLQNLYQQYCKEVVLWPCLTSYSPSHPLILRFETPFVTKYLILLLKIITNDLSQIKVDFGKVIVKVNELQARLLCIRYCNLTQDH